MCLARRVLLVLCLPVCVAETLHDPGSLGITQIVIKSATL